MFQSPFPLHVPKANSSSLVRIVIHFSATILLIHVYDIVTIYINIYILSIISTFIRIIKNILLFSWVY